MYITGVLYLEIRWSYNVLNRMKQHSLLQYKVHISISPTLVGLLLTLHVLYLLSQFCCDRVNSVLLQFFKVSHLQQESRKRDFWLATHIQQSLLLTKCSHLHERTNN